MKRSSLLAAIAAILLTSCATHLVDLGFNPSGAGVAVPALKSIVTPDNADTALFIIAHLYHATAAGVNLAHVNKRITDAKWAELVASDDSIAEHVRQVALLAGKAIDQWRVSGDRTSFNVYYQQIEAEMAQLAEGAK